MKKAIYEKIKVPSSWELGIDPIIKSEKYAEPIKGDMRTAQVKHGDFYAIHNGHKYFMTSFVGIVTKVQLLGLNPPRARIVIDLQNSKRLAFFANIDENIKEGTIIEAIGVCVKNGNGFYNFKCYGGYRRIITNEEIKQIEKGVSFDNVKVKTIPWEIISFVKESDIVNWN